MINKFNNYPISFVKVIFAYSLYIALVFNYPLLAKVHAMFEMYPHDSEFFEYFFLFLLALTILFLLAILFFIFGTRYLLKPFIFLLLINSAILAYYKKNYGVSVDEGIITSLFDSIIEKNYHEVYDLLTNELFVKIVITALIPALPLYFIKIQYPKLLKEYVIRVSYICGMLIVWIAIVASNYKDISLTVRANRYLNKDVIPLYSVSSLLNIIKHFLSFKSAYAQLDEQPSIYKPDEEMVGIVVVGETARADHFSLNGYSRKTNPKLEKQNLSNFNNAYSCGTLTKTSVPCMFYVGDYASFDVAKANQRANLLSIITASGVAVTWFNNNSGCKHVCDKVKTIDLTKIYSEEQYDEQLIIELDKILDNNKSKKTLLVLHSMGSHGPKYYKRYPKEFDKFQPSCKNNNPQECSKEELINAYDNTILYTDHFLDLLINKLKKQNKKSFLIYASDHGESLGEHGLYLHGVPIKFAPEEQIHIPFFIWFSELYKQDRSFTILDAKTKISHEHYPHTILDAMQVTSKYFKKEKSLLR